METQTVDKTLDPQYFRQVLGHYPTGVCVVTATDPELGPIGMTVGSFTSVSLDPALIAFLPTRESGTYQRILNIGTFCVNVLASDQDDVCRLFARRGTDKFGEVGWHGAPSGAPVLDGAIAWIDCELSAVHEAGDHDIVIGAVTGLGTTENAMPPLLFFQGGYGRFSTLSLLAGAEEDLPAHLRLADVARPRIEALAERYKVDCHASAVIGDQLIQLAYAGAGGSDPGSSKVGLRLPFIPPMGSLFVAWAGPETVDAWLARSGNEDPLIRARFKDHLNQIRIHGWAATPDDDRLHAVESVVTQMAANGALPAKERELQDLLKSVAKDYAGVTDPGPGSGVHSISAPVFDGKGDVVLMLTLNERRGRTDVRRAEYQAALIDAAARVTQDIHGTWPR